MAVAQDSPQGTREIEVPSNIFGAQESSLISDIRHPPLPPLLPTGLPRQQRPTNRYTGIRDSQAAHVVSEPNDDSRPPASPRSQSNQGNQITGGGAGVPFNTANACPRWQLDPQPPTGPQARNRDKRIPGNDGLEPPDQGSSIGGAGGRPHRNPNQGAQRSKATQNSGDSPALNPSTQRFVRKRDALHGLVRVNKRAGTIREIAVRPQVGAQEMAQLRQQSLPYPAPSLSPTSTGSHDVRPAEMIPRMLGARCAAVVPASNRYPLPEGFAPLPLMGTTTRAPHLPVIIDTSDTPFSSDEYVSAEGADSTETTVGAYTRSSYERISLHLSAANQNRPKTEPRLQPVSSPCLICFHVPDEFPDYRPTSSCTHTVTICVSCLEQYISHAIRSEGLTKLTCPDPACQQVMEYVDVVRGARENRECVDRYEGLLRLRRLEKEPNFIRCKNPTCNWGQIHERGAAVPIVICEVCHAQSCFTHDTPWHTGLTCEQYTATQQAKRAAEDQANQAYIDQHAKICPNPSCGRWIEKMEGCDHMTCRRPAGCGHEFCWGCLADYGPIHREGSHRHAPSCQNYVPQLERYIPAIPMEVRNHIPQRERYMPPIAMEVRLPEHRPDLFFEPRTARRRRFPPVPSQAWLNRLFGRKY